MRVLKKGMVGNDVKAVQGLLAAKGFFKGSIRGNFLDITDKAVRKFQYAEGLKVDGIVGRLTFAALSANGPTETTPDPKDTGGKRAVYLQLQAEIVDLWLKDVGQREEWGNNRGVMEDEINRVIGSGAKSAAPYCIAGLVVRGVIALCAKHNLVMPKGMKTAGTQAFYRSCPTEFKHPKGKKLKKSFIGILQNKADKGKGHAYGLTEDETDKQDTIEYNTNVAGSRDGDGTYRSRRSQSGTSSKVYLGGVDVIGWLLSANPTVKELS